MLASNNFFMIAPCPINSFDDRRRFFGDAARQLQRVLAGCAALHYPIDEPNAKGIIRQ
jgi:hypothetical protein